MTGLAIFGASGRTGQILVSLAASGGLGVRALVRSTAAFDPPPGVDLLRGSLEDAEAVRRTVRGAAAVACVFGPRTAKVLPFAARATAQVIAAMKAEGATRLVCQTGAMVGELPPSVSPMMRAMARLFRRQVQGLAADAAEQERLVIESGLDWLLVKPPRLADGPPAGRVRAGPALRVGMMSSIRRADLAAFLLDELTDARHHRQRVYVRG